MEENEKIEKDEQKNNKVFNRKVLFIIVCLILIAVASYGIYFVFEIYPTGYFSDGHGNVYNRYLPWHQDEYKRFGYWINS